MEKDSYYQTLVRFRRKLDKAVASAWFFLCDQFVEQLPAESLQNLPSPYIYWSGGFIYAVLLGVFMAVFITVFLNANAERFLSLTSEGMICEKVYKEFNGVYLIDNHGNWEGSAEFLYTRAIYRLDINNFKGSSQDFTGLMAIALMAIGEIGKRAMDYNLGINLIFWMMYQGTAKYQGSNQVISLAGSPKTIFNKQTLAGNLNNRNGVCDLVPRINYYKSDSLILFEYNYDAFVASPTCMDIIDPASMGYDQYLGQGVFKIAVDVQAIVTAVGVNLGLLSADELQEIPGSQFTYMYRGQEITLKKFYYPRFPGMTPLTCYGVQDDSSLSCALEIGHSGLVGYPLFDHAGYSSTEPKRCECNIDYPESIFEACNAFRLLGGMMFYSNPNGGSLDSFIDFVLGSGYSPSDVFELSFNATYDAANVKNVHRNDIAWRYRAFEFCSKAEIANSTCGIVSFYTGDSDYAVTDYYYPVYWGSCNDSFTVSQEIQEKMISSPPTEFTEIYLECRHGFLEVLNNSIGLAMGNLALYIPIVVFIATCLMTIYTKWRHVEVAHTYTSEEKNDILQYFAFNMLLARDGYYRYQSNGKPSSTGSEVDAASPRLPLSLVIALKDELSVNAGISRFYHDNESAETRAKTALSVEPSSEVELAELGSPEEECVCEKVVREQVIVDVADERLKSSDYIENPLFRSTRKP